MLQVTSYKQPASCFLNYLVFITIAYSRLPVPQFYGTDCTKLRVWGGGGVVVQFMKCISDIDKREKINTLLFPRNYIILFIQCWCFIKQYIIRQGNIWKLQCLVLQPPPHSCHKHPPHAVRYNKPSPSSFYPDPHKMH